MAANSNSVNKILKKVIKEHLPNTYEQKQINFKIDGFLNKLKKAVTKNKINAEVMFGGSAAKGTFLKEDFDVDVFVRFDYSYNNKDISEMLSKVLKGIKSLKVSRVHGSRDYFQIRVDGIKYEVVPVLKVDDPKKALNVTDMSPLHVKWVKKHLNAKYRKDIVAAKLFCKAQKVYGAESYINGFSGHVLDVLVVYYKGFLGLLKASQKWKQKEVVDFERYGTAKTLNHSKISPLIVIDPILPERNAAAALSKEKIDIFKKKAKEFLNKPSEEFFVRKEYSLDDLMKLAKKSKCRLLLLDVVAFKGKEDIVGSKLLKAFTHLNKHLIINEFIVKYSGWKWNKKEKAVFWYIVDKNELSEELIRMGPPMKAKNASVEFRKKHKKTFLRENRYYAFVKRNFRKPEDLIKHLIKQGYVKEKVKKIKLKVY